MQPTYKKIKQFSYKVSKVFMFTYLISELLAVAPVY